MGTQVREIPVSGKTWRRGTLAGGTEGKNAGYCALGHVFKAYGVAHDLMKDQPDLQLSQLPEKAKQCLATVLYGNGDRHRARIVHTNDSGMWGTFEQRFESINSYCELHDLPFRFKIMPSEE